MASAWGLSWAKAWGNSWGPIQAAAEEILAGAGYPIRIHKQKKHKRIDDVIEKSMREMYEGVIELATPKVKKQAAKIVRPYIEKGVKPLTIPPAIIIDWAELERDAARVSALLALWQEQMEQFREEEDILLLLMAA